MLYEGSGAFKEMIKNLQQKQPDREPHQHFCNRFSFKLYQPVTRFPIFKVSDSNPYISADTACVDPREGSSMQSAVERHEDNWNTEHPDNKRYALI